MVFIFLFRFFFFFFFLICVVYSSFAFSSSSKFVMIIWLFSLLSCLFDFICGYSRLSLPLLYLFYLNLWRLFGSSGYLIFFSIVAFIRILFLFCFCFSLFVVFILSRFSFSLGFIFVYLFFRGLLCLLFSFASLSFIFLNF